MQNFLEMQMAAKKEGTHFSMADFMKRHNLNQVHEAKPDTEIVDYTALDQDEVKGDVVGDLEVNNSEN